MFNERSPCSILKWTPDSKWTTNDVIFFIISTLYIEMRNRKLIEWIWKWSQVSEQAFLLFLHLQLHPCNNWHQRLIKRRSTLCWKHLIWFHYRAYLLPLYKGIESKIHLIIRVKSTNLYLHNYRPYMQGRLVLHTMHCIVYSISVSSGKPGETMNENVERNPQYMYVLRKRDTEIQRER